ncbi:hypothetical protein C7212DRAFT_210137, partial [Tuber magnatum]
GSIRVPVRATGVFRLRPSCGRFPHKNLAQSVSGQETSSGVVGPVTNPIADAQLFVQTVLEADSRKHDPGEIELRWRPSKEETRELVTRGLPCSHETQRRAHFPSTHSRRAQYHRRGKALF